MTRVIFTGPAAGSNSSPTILSNIRTAGVLGSQTATSIAVTLPTNLVTGSYAVSIVHPGGEITAGGTVWVTIDGNPVVTLSAPATFTASGGSRKVSLSWTAVLGATGYNIYQSTSAGVSITWSSKVAPCQACISLDTPTISNGATTSFIDGKNTFNTAPGASGLLSSNTKYYYVIRAINNANLESPSSIEVSATTGP